LPGEFRVSSPVTGEFGAGGFGEKADRTITETIEIARDIAKKLIETQSVEGVQTALASDPGHAIPSSRQNPKILWVDDAEVVRDRIAQLRPVLRDFLA